jgi:hypothetical protein
MDFNNTFAYDLNIGQKYERKFAGMLEGKIEIKTDRIAHNTGNIFIEFESRKKPSGISTTQADYWAYCVPLAPIKNIFVILPVPELKRLAREYYEAGKIRHCGDGNTSRCVVIPITELFVYAKR